MFPIESKTNIISLYIRQTFTLGHTAKNDKKCVYTRGNADIHFPLNLKLADYSIVCL